MASARNRSGYGTSLTTTVTSGYGTQNPGPGSITPFMGSTPQGEMLGTASDGSSLAAYAPIVHTMPCKIHTKNPKQFVPEGTLMTLISCKNCKRVHSDCVTGDDFVLSRSKAAHRRRKWT